MTAHGHRHTSWSTCGGDPESCRREKAASPQIELEARQMISWHFAISAIMTSAAVAVCITYLLRSPMASVEADQQPNVTRLSLSGADTANSKAAGKHPIENEKQQ
jgi:hypothetical protein